jgi:MFS family permease
MDVSSEMIHGLLPAFMTTVLLANPLVIGAVEGLAEATSLIVKVFSGAWSDRMRRRKVWALVGYGLAAASKPFIAVAGSVALLTGARFADRVGKGLRTAPRESLLAEQATPQTRGKVFGFHRAMDHTGAVLGPLAAIALLSYFGGDLRKVFLCAAVPGVLALLVAYFWVREGKGLGSGPKAESSKWSWTPPKEIRPLLLPLAVFTLGASSDMFLLLKAGQSRAPLMTLPLLWMGLHVVKVLSSLASGPLVDRFGARLPMTLGWLVYIAVYAAMAFVSEPGTIAAIFLFYGLFHGLTEGPEKAMVAQLTPAHLKGTCFGWYGLTTGVLALPAGLFFGWLWDAHGQAWAFGSGAAFAAVALVLLWLQPQLSRSAPRSPLRRRRATA